jgi:beta-galactosidase
MKRRRFLQAAGLAALVGPETARAAAIEAAPSPEPLKARHPGERLSLDLGWRFHRGDVPVTPPHTGDGTYASTKAGAAPGAAALYYNDSAWRELDLPHDFVVEGPFEETANVAQGYRPKGVAWYRRSFHLDRADQGKHLELQFDGIATEAVIWVNGNVVAHSLSGYSSTYIDITAFARFGTEANVIAVRVDADPMEGWWYEGGGVYRHTWLVKRSPVHIVTDGVYAHPRKGPSGGWVLPVEATLANIGERLAVAEVESVLVDPQGKPVAQARASIPVDTLGRAVVRLELTVANPQLWSIETPTLHAVRTRVIAPGGEADEAVTLCGFRTQRFDPDHGFFLNERPVKIQGVCIHQDHAGVGLWGVAEYVIGALGLAPLGLLLAPAVRCGRSWLLGISAAVLVGKALEAAWLVLPGAPQPGWALALLSVAAFAGIGLLGLAALLALSSVRAHQAAPA